LDGIIEHGVYINADPADDCKGLTVEQIIDGYGVHGVIQQRRSGKTGAGQTDEDPVDIVNLEDAQDSSGSDDNGSDDSGSDDGSESGQVNAFNSKFTAPPVHVPRVINPFADSPQLGQIFTHTLRQVQQQGVLPEGYNIRPDEWEHGAYPSFYYIRSGKKSGRELRVDLPDMIWHQRAEMWAQALDVYKNLLAHLDID
jgi:hypothetical protein